jgi:hypothetical protein
MAAALKAGVSYFALVYLAGFILGTVRVLLIAPCLGETAAVLLETPIILAASWIASRWCTAEFAVQANPLPRLLMGGIAFALLITGELGVSVFVFGRSWEGALTAFRSPPGIVGLSAQAAFELFPLVQTALRRNG